MKKVIIALAILAAFVSGIALAADTSEAVNKSYTVTKVRVNSVTLNFTDQTAGVSCSMLDAQGKEMRSVSLTEDPTQWNKWGGTLTDMGKRAMKLCRAQEGLL